MSMYNVLIRLTDKRLRTYNILELKADNRQEAKDYAIQRMAIDIGKPVKIADININGLITPKRNQPGRFTITVYTDCSGNFNYYNIGAEKEQDAEYYAIQCMAIDIGKPVEIADIMITQTNIGENHEAV